MQPIVNQLLIVDTRKAKRCVGQQEGKIKLRTEYSFKFLRLDQWDRLLGAWLNTAFEWLWVATRRSEQGSREKDIISTWWCLLYYRVRARWQLRFLYTWLYQRLPMTARWRWRLKRLQDAFLWWGQHGWITLWKLRTWTGTIRDTWLWHVQKPEQPRVVKCLPPSKTKANLTWIRFRRTRPCCDKSLRFECEWLIVDCRIVSEFPEPLD